MPGPGRRFLPGNNANPAGRPLGARNKSTLEIKSFARSVFENPEYQQSLITRLVKGKAPHMEVLLAHYGFGKPIERIAAQVNAEDKAVPRSPIWSMSREDKIRFLE